MTSESANGADTQLVSAREVPDSAVANAAVAPPRHPGDVTPRLLLIKRTLGAYAEGRLLMSPWSAFKGGAPA
eukprot:4491255-Prymnesium_polylepis.1